LGQLFYAGDGTLRAEGNVPSVRMDAAFYHLDKGGFAAAVDTNQADPIPWADFKRYIGKKNSFSKFLPNLYNIHDSHTFPYAVYHTMPRMGTFCKKFKLYT
jgi:hypothetical protein